MRIKPDDNWCWYYDEEYDYTMFDLADGTLLRLRFAHKILIPGVSPPSGFCVDDAALYFPFEEKCHYLDLAEEQKTKLVLNAPVAIHYPKPQMPKSWRLVTYGINRSSVVGDAACVDLSNTDEQVDLLMVEPDENVAPYLLM